MAGVQGPWPGVDDPAVREALLEMITGSWRSQLVRTLAELEVPDILHGSPRSSAEIAMLARCDGEAVFRLLRAAVSVGLVTYDGEAGCFAATRLLDRLRAAADGSMRHLAISSSSPGRWVLWSRLPEAVRSGHEQSTEALGQPLSTYYDDHHEERARCARGFGELSVSIIAEACAAVGSPGGDEIVDLGVAARHLVLALLERDAGATTGVVLEQSQAVGPPTAAIATRGVAGRCVTVAGDVSPLPTADVYLLGFVLHERDDDACVALLDRCRRAMRTRGLVVVVDAVVGPVSDPGPGALLDLDALAHVPGREHDLADLDRFASAAGLVRARTTALRPPYCIVELVADAAH